MNEIINEKQILIENLSDLKNKYTLKNIEYKTKKCKILLETDFVKTLNKSRPTVDEKNAYVDLNTIDLRKEKELLYNEIELLKLKIELCDNKLEVDK